MSFFRSAQINHYQLILPRQNSYRVIAQLGRMGIVQFGESQFNHQDMSYLSQVKICQLYLQNIKTIEKELYEQGRGLSEPFYNHEDYDVFLQTYDRRYRMSGQSHQHLLQKIVEDIEIFWNSREQLKQRKIYLQREMQQLKEQRCILQIAAKLFRGRLSGQLQQKEMRFKLGIILKKHEYSFKRTIFRMSKGFSLVETMDGESQSLNTQGNEKKVAFYLYCSFFTGQVLQNKLKKLFQTYDIKQLNYAGGQPGPKQRLANLQQLALQNNKMQQLVDEQSKRIYQGLLETIPTENQFKMNKLEYYKLYLLHEKTIYTILSRIKVQNSFTQAQIYVPTYLVSSLTDRLQFTLLEDKMPVPQLIPILGKKKPTLFQANSFTITQYQVLTAFGVPHYQEANPAFFNVITFPFLFGVMFGDIGHGLVLLGFGLILLFIPTFFKIKIAQMLIKHKWSIVLMGFFSTYCGFIYNEYFSISLNIFGSCYELGPIVAKLQQGCVYPFGVDPVWSIAENQLQFTNSLKMKISVIIAVVHMTLGLVLKAVNQMHAKKYFLIFIQTLPQLTFFLLFFGYMDFLIIYKWTHEWVAATAPSIITTMINIPLQLGKTEDCCGGQPMWGNYQETSQNAIQIAILVVMLICIPMILCLRPLYQYCRQRKKVIEEQQVDLELELRESRLSHMGMKNNLLASQQPEEALIPIRELIVHQIIETIEFVLGSISNTASYLRLWALSLAHTSLSEVFFEQTVQKGLKAGFVGLPLNIILFPIFACITFGILLCMDVMECFLHSLRLHWVQFQNKFFKGDGNQFQTLSFRGLTNEWLELNRIQ